MTGRHDLVILGAGSGNSILDDSSADLLLSRPYWTYPALSEVVQQALVDLT